MEIGTNCCSFVGLFMKKCQSQRMTQLSIALCVLAFGTISVWATDMYEYGFNEYVTITDGTSPNGKYAITAHGDGDFHIFLTDARTGKKIGPLEEIVETLDTGAGSFCALWSKNSEEVSIFYRISRHQPIEEIFYRIVRDRAFLIKGPAYVEPDYTWYWSQHCSSLHQAGKTFGTPLPR
jgi:WD40 repeat protein